MYTIFYNSKRLILAESSEPIADMRPQLNRTCNTIEELKSGIDEFISNQLIFTAVMHSGDFKKLWSNFESLYTVIEAAGGIVLNPDNQLLVIFRNGRWDLPKGKLEDDEDLSEAAIREVEEECGLNGLVCLNHIYTTFHTYELENQVMLKETYWFMMKYNGTEIPKPQKEENIAEALFVDFAQLKHLMQNMHASIKMLINDVFGKSGHAGII